MGKTVLVVSDDEQIRRLVGRILGRFGHSMTMTGGYDDAIERLRRSGGGFDVLVTDLELDLGRNGAELVAAAKALDPYIRTVLFTGSAQPDIYARFRQIGLDWKILHSIVYKGRSDVVTELVKAVEDS